MSYTDNERKEKLGCILRKIHDFTPSIGVDTNKVANYEIRKGFFEGESINRLIIYLRSSGCQWMLEDDNGGCAMCGHLAGTTRGRKISTSEYVLQLQDIISKIDFKEISMMCVYNAGSFFNDAEIEEEARVAIYKEIAKISEIRHIIFESRPKHITEEKMKSLTKYLVGKSIEIGMGLESSDEYVREICLNKGFVEQEFRTAVQTLKKYSVKSLAYVLLKPPFLTESMGIEDSIRTIQWAFTNGIDVVSLEPVSVQKNTLLYLMMKVGMYCPPYIWSVLKVIEGVHDYGLVRIGGFEYFPLPKEVTHNCDLCNDYFINVIEKYNETNNIEIVKEALDSDCEGCKDVWLSTLKREESVRDEIDRFLELISKDNGVIERVCAESCE